MSLVHSSTTYYENIFFNIWLLLIYICKLIIHNLQSTTVHIMPLEKDSRNSSANLKESFHWELSGLTLPYHLGSVRLTIL